MSQKKKNSKKKIAIVIATVLLAITTLFLCFIYVSSKNYAKQTAEPIEAALIKAGAVKQCESGDTGRGPDNNEPWYGAAFSVNQDVESTKRNIQDILKDGGYSSGELVFDDQYKEWTIQGEMRKSPYKDLLQGNIKVGVTIYEQKHFDAQRDQQFCTLSGEGSQQGVTTFFIGVDLPEYR